MSYSYKLDKALDQIPSGNLEQYFDFELKQLQENDGRSDNKCLSIDAYDPPCPVAKGMYTKLKLTDESVDIINMDKSSITATVRINLNVNNYGYMSDPDINHMQLDKTLYDLTPIDTNASTGVKDELAFFNDLKFEMTKIFIGFKSSIHLLDAYRIYSNGKKTLCEQTEALFENAALRMIKCQEELDEKPGIYTTWEHAYHNDNTVCGTYVTLKELFDGPVQLEFEVTIPIDEFLPFNAMTLYPNSVFGNLQIEIKMAIQNNFVCCQVSSLDSIASLLSSCINTNDVYLTQNTIDVIMPYAERLDYLIKKSFTQCGDKFTVYGIVSGSYINGNPTRFPSLNPITSTETFDEVISRCYGIKQTDISIDITTGSLMSCRTNLNGFGIKDSVKDKLITKYSQKPLIIPSQFIDYQAFSQPPMSFGLKCNTTYNLTNCSALLFLFPRTNHEITCCRNPFLASIQVQVDNKPYPDKPISTLEAAHTIYNLTNLGYDSIFSTSKEYSNALQWNELQPAKQIGNATLKLNETEDNTSYCFVCSTERLSGFGTFCDGLNKDNAHITLTGTLMALPNGTQYHPYYQPDGNVNNRPPIMLICQDCFWRCSPKEGIEFIINDKNFYKQISEYL